MKARSAERSIAFGFFATVALAGVVALNANASPRTGGQPIAGPPDAAVTIEEFVDFQCGFCARGSESMKQALQDYPGKVRLVLRNLPLPFHAHALVAAKAFVAASLQGQSLAYAFQDELFAHQAELRAQGEPYLYEVAAQVGLNVARLKTEMSSSAVAQAIADDAAYANRHSVTATPTYLIGAEKIVGAVPYEDLKAAIERQLGH